MSTCGGQQPATPGLESACPAWAVSAPLGWEWPGGGTAVRIRASLWWGVLSQRWRAELCRACPRAPGLRAKKSIDVAEACVQAVVCQCQEKTGTVALLGAVSVHWCGAGMLAGWKTAPGALWRWGRGAQPGLWVAYPSTGVSPGWPLCLAPCSPGNASVPSVCSRRKCRKKFMFTVSK